MDPDDLLQEAMKRAVDTRTCPSHVDVIRFLAEAMRSIAGDDAAKIANRVPIVSVAKTGRQDVFDALVERVRSEEPTPEDAMIRAEETIRIKAGIFALFTDDAVARDLVEGLIEGLTTDEVRQLTGLDETGYETKRKLIRRRINKAFPNGWTK